MVSLMLLSDGSWFSLCLLAMAREGAGDIIGAVDTGQECQALRFFDAMGHAHGMQLYCSKYLGSFLFVSCSS